MPLSSGEQMEQIVAHLREMPGLAEQLPATEKDIVRAALEGQDIHAIASSQHMAEAAVWRVLDSAARWASGQPAARAPEQAGLGSDTDPGVTGGYGDTAFGSLGEGAPYPTPEEPPFKGEGKPNKEA